ncbi:hypothetical protein GF324_08130, partial [bacterium]|nr:hypothetical protein [bacterium]
MGRSTVVSIMVCLCLVFTVQGQITLELSDLPQEPGVEISKTLGMNTMAAGPAGENQVWDFSTIQTVMETREIWDNPEGHPGAGTFPTSDLVMYSPAMQGFQMFVYFQLLNNNRHILGSTYVSNGTPTVAPAETNGPNFVLPCTYGDSWDFIMSVDMGETTNYDSTRYEVDAWGTVTTQYGTFESLRIRLNTTNMELPDGETETRITYM